MNNSIHQYIKNLNELKKLLLETTIEAVICEMYLSQPLACAETINKILREYELIVSELAEEADKNGGPPERKMSRALKEYNAFLSQARVGGKNFMAQRDKIANEITGRVSKITAGVQGSRYNPERLSELVKITEGAYYARKKQVERWKKSES